MGLMEMLQTLVSRGYDVQFYDSGRNSVASVWHDGEHIATITSEIGVFHALAMAYEVAAVEWAT